MEMILLLNYHFKNYPEKKTNAASRKKSNTQAPQTTHNLFPHFWTSSKRQHFKKINDKHIDVNK